MSQRETAVLVDRPGRTVLIVANQDARTLVLSLSRTDGAGETHDVALIGLSYDEVYALHDAIQDRDHRASGITIDHPPPVTWVASNP